MFNNAIEVLKHKRRNSLQVAVSTDGTIFVSDGYCNARVVRYSAKGVFEAEYRLPRGDMLVPHSLALEECSDSLYVADRENSQVHRFSIKTQSLQGKGASALQGTVPAAVYLSCAHRPDYLKVRGSCLPPPPTASPLFPVHTASCVPSLCYNQNATMPAMLIWQLPTGSLAPCVNRVSVPFKSHTSNVRCSAHACWC